jgi:FkbM family methyltransferase
MNNTDPNAQLFKLARTLIESINHILVSAPELADAVEKVAQSVTNKNINLAKSLNLIKSSGVAVTKVLDIGAHIGEWYQQFNSIFPDANVLSVEANFECMDELKLANPNSICACVAGTDSLSREFFLPKFGASSNTGASMYVERSYLYDDAQKINVRTMSLDSLAEGRCFDYIKLDVQGAELEILSGSIKTFKDASFVQIELSLVQYNENSPLFAEVCAFMHHHNFFLYNITELMFYQGKLTQMDVIFSNNRNKHLVEEFRISS